MLQLKPQEQQRIELAIREAEQVTSAELKVILTRYCWGRLEEKAVRLFHQHGLDRTQHRNAILVLVVMANREILVHGDQAANDAVCADFWKEVCNVMLEHCCDGKVADGVIAGIRLIAETMAGPFPPGLNNPNEISDEVTIDDTPTA
ncbi:MAG: TPM domain-containing protein [Planctomycetaceae bacterium]|nr:TPM domain-containing protein [Planctomycetaceae bacterium]